MATFGEKVKYLRESKNITTRDLAEVLGISYAQINRYEHSINSPSLGTAKKYAEHFNVSLDYLANDNNDI